MDYSPPASSVYGVSQARILEWVAISFSRGSSQPRDQNSVSCIANGFFTSEPLVKAHFSVTLTNCTLNRHHLSISLKDFLKFVILPSSISLISPILGMSVIFFIEV